MHREQVERLVGMRKLFQADELQRPEAALVALVCRKLGTLAKHRPGCVAGMKRLRRRIERKEARMRRDDLVV